MSPSQSIVAIAGLRVEKVISVDPLHVIAYAVDRPRCVHCGVERVWKKDCFLRKVRHVSVGSRATVLFLRAHKYHCQGCKRYFHSVFPGVLPKKRATESFRKEVFDKHHGGIPQSQLAAMLRIGAATIERWYQDFLQRFLAETSGVACPRVLGIDEHFFSRKKGYATSLCDLKRRCIFDVTMGRSEKSLCGYLARLPDKHRTRVAVMDLSETYRSIVRKHFPKALIVADRFHVVRLINHSFLKAWAQLDPVGRKNRGLLSLMRRHRRNLAPEQAGRLASYLKAHPVLHTVYDFKTELVELMGMKRQTARKCKRLIPRFLDAIEKLLACPIESLQTLGSSLGSSSKCGE